MTRASIVGCAIAVTIILAVIALEWLNRQISREWQDDFAEADRRLHPHRDTFRDLAGTPGGWIWRSTGTQDRAGGSGISAGDSPARPGNQE